MTCTRHNRECIHVTNQNETRQLAAKRKFEEVTEQNKDLQRGNERAVGRERGFC